MKWLATGALASALLLAGCASYSGIAPETKTLDAAALGAGSADASDAEWPAADWWQAFADPTLNALVEQALAGNPSLQTAAARLRRAAALADQAESALAPQAALASSNRREHFSENGLIPPPYAGSTRNVNELQLDGHWELDFFGKNREQLQASVGELRASEAEYQATRMLLANEVARSYYKLARLLTLRGLAERHQRQRSELGALVERRVNAGLDTQVELESAQGMVAENARDIGSLDEQIAIARHALAALSGRAPETSAALTPALPAVAPLALPAALPAELLGHRADVAAARWRVESSLHGLAATRAQFYPNVDLRAFVGFSAVGYAQWLDASSRHPGAALAISLPIFDAGRLRNLYRGSAAAVDSAVASYNATLLDAVRDVADQLSTLTALDAQITRQQAAQASAERSYALAERRYRADISDRLSVLAVESKLIEQRRIAVDLQARWIDSRIHLIRALGGGYSAPALVAASK